MKRIRIALKNATIISGAMPLEKAVELVNTIKLPLMSCVCIVDA